MIADRLIVAVGCAALVGLLPVQSLAKEDTVASCRRVGDAVKRLACYDAIADRDLESTKVRQQKQFGLTERQKAPEDRKEADSITASVASASGLRIALDNGMVWRVVDNQRAADWVQKGRKVTVERGLLSGYRMNVEGVNGTMVVERMN